MSERKWLPDEYSDEVFPPPRDSPDAWVRKMAADVYALDKNDLSAALDGEGHLIVLHDGDVLKFSWTEHFGLAEVTFGPDGIWTVDRQPPPECTQVMQPGDPDTVAYGSNGEQALHEFVTAWVDNETPDEFMSVDVIYYTWSDGIPFRFQGGKFTEVPKA